MAGNEWWEAEGEFDCVPDIVLKFRLKYISISERGFVCFRYFVDWLIHCPCPI